MGRWKDLSGPETALSTGYLFPEKLDMLVVNTGLLLQPGYHDRVLKLCWVSDRVIFVNTIEDLLCHETPLVESPPPDRLRLRLRGRLQGKCTNCPRCRTQRHSSLRVEQIGWQHVHTLSNLDASFYQSANGALLLRILLLEKQLRPAYPRLC